jgi:hypothetical protein
MISQYLETLTLAKGASWQQFPPGTAQKAIALCAMLKAIAVYSAPMTPI